MREFTLPYGRGAVRFAIPSENAVSVLSGVGAFSVPLAEGFARASIYLYSEMDDRPVERFFLNPIADLQDIVPIARDQFGEGFRTAIIPDAVDTFPVR